MPRWGTARSWWPGWAPASSARSAAQLLDDGFWYIGRLLVVPDRQRQGFGGRLFAEIEALAPPDAVGFRLTTGGNSLGNHAFYRRRGYAEVSRSGGPDEVPLLTMEKTLPEPAQPR